MRRNNLFLLLFLFICASCNASHIDNETVSKIKEVTTVDKKKSTLATSPEDGKEGNMEVAIIGGGCFWCTEAQYLALKGVTSVVSGYAGGSVANPTYKEICTGTTGHAEVIRIEYDPSIISYEEILQAFFVAHDPTQLNRQGADVGTQYRSTIMPLNDAQKKIAEDIIKEFNEQEVFSHKVVTVIEPNQTFYPAEDYHQNYYENNGGANPYCTRVVGPKLEKFKKVFKDKLK